MATAMTSYREASWSKSRTFEITPDSVIVRNWGFAGRVPESEVILLLAELSPQVSGRSWMKGDDQHTVLFGISAFLGIGAVTWLALSAGGRDPAWLSIVPGMLGALV